MAIDAKKMQAFVKQGPGSGTKGPPPNKGAKDGADDEADKAAGGEDDEEGGDKYGHLTDLLKQHGQDIEACIEELDPDQLANFGEELADSDKEILRQGFDDLDQGVTDEAKHVLAGIDEEDAGKIGEQLEGDGAVQDGHTVGAWLFRVGQMLDEAPPSSEKGGDDKDDEDEEGQDDEEDEAGAEA